MTSSHDPFTFAPVTPDTPTSPDFAVPGTRPVSTFTFGPSAASSPLTLREQSDVEPHEQAPHARALEELVADGELVTRAQLEEAIEAARQAAKKELQALHQHELEAQAERHDASMVALFDELQRWREAITHQSTELLLRLCETLTLHLVKSALVEQPERYVQAVTPALEELMGFTRPRLYVPEFALGALTDRLHELQGLHPDHLEVEVLADDTLDVGDFRLEVDGGQIDADLEKRLTHLVETCRQRALAAFAEWDEEDSEESQTESVP